MVETQLQLNFLPRDMFYRITTKLNVLQIVEWHALPLFLLVIVHLKMFILQNVCAICTTDKTQTLTLTSDFNWWPFASRSILGKRWKLCCLSAWTKFNKKQQQSSKRESGKMITMLSALAFWFLCQYTCCTFISVRKAIQRKKNGKENLQVGKLKTIKKFKVAKRHSTRMKIFLNFQHNFFPSL